MRKNIPSLNWLRVFEAAASAESFARAAVILNMSTSAVSQQIRSLESHFGTKLFIRGARQVKLTDSGHALLPNVRHSLMQIEDTAESLFGEKQNAIINLQSTLIFATSWLSPRLTDFSENHPNVQFRITGLYHDMDYKMPGAELKIVFGPVHRNWGQCDRLFDEKIYPVASQHIVDSLHTPENFLDNRLIQVPNHQVTWSQVLREVGLNGTFGEQFCSADSTEMALSLASAGYGIALARFPTTDFLVKKLGLVKCPLVPMIKSTEAYYLVYQSQQSLSKYAHYFRIWLIDSASQYTQN